MSKIQKTLDFTCQECFATYQLLEIHHQDLKPCSKACLNQWKSLLHSHFQEQIILLLAAEEAKQDKDPDNDHE